MPRPIATGDRARAAISRLSRGPAIFKTARIKVPLFVAAAFRCSVRRCRPINSARRSQFEHNAHEYGTVSSFDILWQTGWGSYNRDNHQAKKLLVTVRDMSRKIPKVEVEISFLARDPGTGWLLIYKRTEIPLEMKGLIEVSGYVQSPSIKLNEQHYAALGEHRVSGLKMVGWIVRGKLQGEVFQARASDQTLLEIAQGNPRQPIDLDALIAESEQGKTAPASTNH